MGRNVGKVIILVIPCLATLGLLSYSLLSLDWVQVDEPRLIDLTRSYERDFENIFENRTGRARIGPLVGKSSVANTTVTTTTSTTTTSTTTTTSHSVDLDYTADDYEDEETHSEDEHTHQKRDIGKDAEYARNLFERKQAKNKATQSNEWKRQSNGGEFVYVTQLWPFVKLKGIYAECVDYRPMKLKMSVSYLISDRKAPIVGEIHYIDNTLFDREAVDPTECSQKPGTVYCHFTKSCKTGKSCDGTVDCEDQSDEQLCGEQAGRVCSYANDIVGFNCDSKCYQYWHRCDGVPHCFDLSDELHADCHSGMPLVNFTQSANYFQRTMASFFPPSSDPMQFTLGSDHYDAKNKCFRRYFNFKSARLIPKETLKYLTQPLADNIQETNNLNYHLHLIYTLAFLAAISFCLLALLSLLFLTCFGKLCFQCPFWFFGFFQILAWLTSLCGLMTYLYAFWADKQRSLDPNAHTMILPVRAEFYRLNDGLAEIEKLGLAFWLATGAVGSAFFGSFLACLVCCRLPSSRHEDKEYKIMQLPTYS